MEDRGQRGSDFNSACVIEFVCTKTIKIREIKLKKEKTFVFTFTKHDFVVAKTFIAAKSLCSEKGTKCCLYDKLLFSYS